MSNEQTYWANACAVLVTGATPSGSKEECVRPALACESSAHRNILPLFAAVEALRGKDGYYPTEIEIKDGVLHITFSDGSVLTTDGSTLVTGDYVDNAVKPYICQSFTERTLWAVLTGESAVISQEDTDAICFNPKGVRVLFRDDYGLVSGTVLSCGHYYSDILILLVGSYIYYIFTTMDPNNTLVMKSGKRVDIQTLATQKEVTEVRNRVVFMTQAEYDALEEYNNEVLYVVVE